MALLQIAEPGQSAAPHQHKRAAGIDLGTTNSLIASVRSGSCLPLADSEGQVILPSVVYLGESGLQIGEGAKAHLISDPSNTLTSIKRMMGKSLAELEIERLPYQLKPSEQGLPLLQTSQGTVNPIQVSSYILKSLKQRAEQTLDGELDGVVITVPAYFDDAQRQSTKDAAELAGMHVLRLLNEPTAAAIAYGLDSEQEGVIAVYDLGGGTFDISILRLTRGVFEVLATGGNSALGGDDFDHMIADWIQEQAGIQNPDASLTRQIIGQATAAKIALSDQAQAGISISGDSAWQGTLTREQLDQLIAPLVKQTLKACRRALKDAGVTKDEVAEVVMVGGSTRVPLVRSQVGQFFATEPLTSIDPDQVVAIGAGIQADILIGNKPESEILLLDVLPLSLGIETMGGLVEKVIPRNTTIPVARAQEFTTFKDGQTAMALQVVQGERELVSDCRSLAKFTLKNIPPRAAGAAHIRVTFQVDADGLLSVSAREKESGVSASVQVKPSYGLSDDEVTQMLKASLTHAEDDKQARALMEQRVEAKRVHEAIRSALGADADLLSADELKQIDISLAELARAELGDNPQRIKQACGKLEHATELFAAKRMDASIKRALKGHSIDDI